MSGRPAIGPQARSWVPPVHHETRSVPLGCALGNGWWAQRLRAWGSQARNGGSIPLTRSLSMAPELREHRDAIVLRRVADL